MHWRILIPLLGCWLAGAVPAPAESTPPVSAAELAAATALGDARGNPLRLDAFLRGMPKGGDLHMHLTGAIYAETFIADAIEDGLCVDRGALSLVRPQRDGGCAAGQVPAADAPTDPVLYHDLIDAFSMRDFVPVPGVSGHDRFFAAFEHFLALGSAHTGEWLAEVANRAAAQNESYLEIMNTPLLERSTALAAAAGWPARPTTPPDFAAMRTRLLAAGLHDAVTAVSADIVSAEARRDAIGRCGLEGAAPGCAVRMRLLFQVLRGLPPAVVFAQTLLGFETVETELAGGGAHYVGINFVMPEDGYISMRDYALHMRMLDYFHTVYPRVRISLHAGELAPGLVPPDGLRFHIRAAVDEGHAERIGHGVDALYEDDPAALLADMARKHVMVEINLTSNDVILGVHGVHHPLSEYLAAGVPVALATDDEGVSRIDLTHEYVRAVTDFGLGYGDLKRFARTSLEHSFLPGSGVWRSADQFAAVVDACAGPPPGDAHPGVRCAAYLAASPKAAAQWDLERRFQVFEAKFHP